MWWTLGRQCGGHWEDNVVDTGIAPFCPCFYKSCIQIVLTFSFLCWLGNVSQTGKNNSHRIVNISSKETGLKQFTLTALYEKQVLWIATKIISDNTHILHKYVLCPQDRPEGLDPSHPKQIGSVYHSFQCLYDFSKTNNCDVSMTHILIYYVCMLYLVYFLFVKRRSQCYHD